jgi:hypothetical protein
LGEDTYSLAFNNCEHFVTWCILGVKSSAQVNSALIGVAGVAINFGTGGVAGIAALASNQLMRGPIGYAGNRIKEEATALAMNGAACVATRVTRDPDSMIGSGLKKAASAAGLSDTASNVTANIATPAAKNIAFRSLAFTPLGAPALAVAGAVSAFKFLKKLVD